LFLQKTFETKCERLVQELTGDYNKQMQQVKRFGGFLNKKGLWSRNTQALSYKEISTA